MEGNNGIFACEELAQVWGVSVTKTSQSLRPWLEKAVKLWRADPDRFMKLLLAANDEMIFDDELELRERMNTGRVDRAELLPKKARPGHRGSPAVAATSR